MKKRYNLIFLFLIAFFLFLHNSMASVITIGAKNDPDEIGSVNRLFLKNMKYILLKTDLNKVNIVKGDTEEIILSLIRKKDAKKYKYIFGMDGKDNIFKVTVIEKGKLSQDTNLSDNYDIGLKVIVPKDLDKRIDFESANGDIKIRDLKELIFVREQVKNIVIRVKNVIAEDLFIENVDSGIENAVLKNDFNYKYATAFLYIKNLKAKNFRSEGTDGDMVIKKIDLENEFNYRINTGDVTVKSIKANDININSTSGCSFLGDIKGNINFKTNSGNLFIFYKTFGDFITAQTNSGNIEIILPKDADFILNYMSTSGKLKNDFDPNENKNSFTKISDNKQPKDVNTIKIDTDSGNCKIVKEK